MNTEQAKQLSETALNRLMAALGEGQSAALKQYSALCPGSESIRGRTCY